MDVVIVKLKAKLLESWVVNVNSGVVRLGRIVSIYSWGVNRTQQWQADVREGNLKVGKPLQEFAGVLTEVPSERRF